ncbi:MAG TPA: hypothetical protein VL241_08240 [Gemmatimonadales bacterium]|nr:hypothetical protein [Gemmatimonadales bacterium]
MHSRRAPERHDTRPGTLFPRGAHTRAALRRAGVLTALGVLGLLPAVLLVVTGMGGLARPRALVQPLLVMGGLALAFSASFVAVTHWEILHEREHWRLVCTVRKRAVDLAVLLASLVLSGIIIGYLFVENYQPR